MAKKTSLLRSPGILLVALVVLVAATGLVYAHWTTTLQTNANVQTGQVAIEWFGAYTDDDGVDNGDGEPTNYEVYDHWGAESSADPSTRQGGGAFPGDSGRYDKDVAKCSAEINGGSLQINIENGYPSYNCTIHGEIGAPNGIPVRATATAMGEAGTHVCGYWDASGVFYPGQVGWDEVGQFDFADLNGNGVFEPDEPDYEFQVWNNCQDAPMTFEPAGDGSSAYELLFNDVARIQGDFGVACGVQIDPLSCNWYLNSTIWDGHVNWCPENEPSNEDQCAYDDQDNSLGVVDWVCDGATTEVEAGWIHILQEADQNSHYYWTLEQDFVNWNEFWAGDCTPGVPVVNGDGTSTSQFACPSDTGEVGGWWNMGDPIPGDGMVPADLLTDCLAWTP